MIGDVGYTFAGFRMESGSHLMVMADVVVRRPDRTQTVSPGMEAGPSGMKPFAAQVPGSGRIGLARIDADHQRVAVTLDGMTASPATAVVDFTTKPLVNLVWIGALLAVLGTGVAGIRRARERTPLREHKAGPPRRRLSREAHA
jgi:hypothetical protein